MYLRGTDELVVIEGVRITAAIDTVLEDHLHELWAVPSNYYEHAARLGIVKQNWWGLGKWVLTPLGKKIFARWIFIRESGAGVPWRPATFHDEEGTIDEKIWAKI